MTTTVTSTIKIKLTAIKTTIIKITIMFTVLTVGPTFPGDEYNFFGVATAWKRLSSREKISWIKIKENFRVESFDFRSKKYFWWSNMHERIFWQDIRATSRKIHDWIDLWFSAEINTASSKWQSVPNWWRKRRARRGILLLSTVYACLYDVNFPKWLR